MRDLKRRDFILGAGGGAIAAGLTAGATGLLHASPSQAAVKRVKGHVVKIQDPGLTDAKAARPVEAMATKMLARAIQELTGKKKPADAWSSLFSAKDMVGVKINCLGKPCLSTTPEVVNAIIEGLRSAGVKEDRIVVFDHFGSHMLMSRFKLKDKEGGVRYVHNKQWGFEEEWRTLPAGKTKFSQVLLKVDKVVSVPVIKDHALSGVTCALKNMAFGTVINPSAHHRNGCDPGIANIYNQAPIKDKVALIVCDGAFMQYDGGPQCKPAARVAHNALYLTHDPVALDKLVWELIDEHRKAKRLPPLHKARNPVHVATAAGLGLGTDDRAAIKVVQAKL
jgi:uncharacterized protein (DUF362 family)